MNNIFILTGKIQTGKTTRLMLWAISQKNIDGILQPIIDGKRFIYHIRSRSLKPLETESKENIISIGKYNFSNETFDWSKQILNDALISNNEWIIIDEIGPLELNGKGLEPTISRIIDIKDKLESKILFVVREEILDKFVGRYKLQNNYNIVDLPS